MRNLPITGEYPADWKAISDATCAAAGHRCIRCLHPYEKGTHGKGEWSPCDDRCRHTGPLGIMRGIAVSECHEDMAKIYSGNSSPVYARWRILTVHHFDGNKANCAWWNLLALCQRCHLTIQCRVNPQQPYMFEHSDWLKSYVAGFYACKYEGKMISKIEAIKRMDQLLAYEKLA